MKTLHTKSLCCRGKIYRFGNRRRQCSICGRTWRIRRKKRGRKRNRINKKLLTKTLIRRQSLNSQMRKNYSSIATLYQRFRKTLIWLSSQPRRYPPYSGQLILVGDGLWYRFKKKDWVLYLMALRPIQDSKAILLDPILLPGKENYQNWKQAIQTLPLPIKKRIKAFVSDGFRGSKKLSKENHWIHQRCHFHLMAQLQARRGRKKKLIGADIRETIYLIIRKVLEMPDGKHLKFLTIYLNQLANHPLCPKKMRMIIHEFLKELDSFRAYLLYPELNLPTTTNTIESTGKMIRKISRSLNTPRSLQLWTTAFIRFRPEITCNGKIFQPN